MKEEKDATKITVTFKLEDGVSSPQYKTAGSSGLDVASIEDKTITAGKWAIIRTGISAEIPEGYEIQVRSRSGLAFKHGIFVLNSPGTVDSDYRGEIKIILANFSEDDFEIKKGNRIAQMVLSKVCTASIKIASSISDTVRGSGGFGHTGI